MTTITVPVFEAGLADWHRVREEDPNHRYELDGGSIIMVAPATPSHNRAVMRLAFWLGGLGFSADVVIADGGLQTDNGDPNGRVPDLMLLREVEPHGSRDILPEFVWLVVEVVSPNTARIDRIDKIREYARNGIPNYWIVDNASVQADDATVTCLRLVGGTYEAHIKDLPLSDLLGYREAPLHD